ncbi:matrix metalloproteinase-28-like, partial [Engraulis encrasicolus]|uniref:matrix metalloproteinase-28-like n=1 Tax=Engraulis encrasicolus TaxID=184585 RepID=UPI002FD34029
VFLERYGYLHQDEHTHNAAEINTAVREFQWLSHLPVTGRVDSATLGKMSSPRCGVGDGGSQRSWGTRVNALLTGGGAHLRRKRYTQTVVRESPQVIREATCQSF